MSKISFVIPCYHSEQTIEGIVKEINVTMQEHPKDCHEIILINDGSPDATFAKIRELCARHPNITGASMAKNFGQHAALMAGFRFAQGDYVVCLDDDGQTPADEVYRLLDKIEEGYDVVYASYAAKKHSLFRNVGSKINSKMTEWMLDKPKELYISSYFAARRFVVEEMTRYTNPYPYVIGLVLQTTSNIACVEVTHREREEGVSGYTLHKLLSLWINGFTAFSVRPLRIATFMGVISAICGFIYAIWAVIHKLLNPVAPMGWTSTIIILLIIGGMILLVLGLIGEYVGRIYISMNSAPQYVMKEVINNNTEGKQSWK